MKRRGKCLLVRINHLNWENNRNKQNILRPCHTHIQLSQCSMNAINGITSAFGFFLNSQLTNQSFKKCVFYMHINRNINKQICTCSHPLEFGFNWMKCLYLLMNFGWLNHANCVLRFVFVWYHEARMELIPQLIRMRKVCIFPNIHSYMNRRIWYDWFDLIASNVQNGCNSV